MNAGAPLLFALAAALVAPTVARAQGAPDGPADPESKADFQHVWTTPDPSPTWHMGAGWATSVYGVERLDLLHDSTPSLGARANNASLATSLPPEAGRTRVVASNSLYGLKVGGPEASPVRALFLFELGAPPSDPDGARGWHGLYGRRLYAGVLTPIVDVLVGRTHDLFGWGGKGFFASTGASLGVPGELYRQRVQLRVSHVFRFRPVDFELAGAAVAPYQAGRRASDVELGLRLAVNGWVGAGAQGASPAETRPLQIGLSSITRRFEIAPFTAQPAPPLRRDIGGLALDVFVPIVAARVDDQANALALDVELSAGSGLADLYPGLTGNALVPALPNPGNMTPPPVVPLSLPPRDVTYDLNGEPHTVNWRAWVLNLQYHLPFARGRRVWLSGTLSGTFSNNLAAVTPPQGRPFIWNDGRYYDLNAFVAIWRGLEAAASYQVTRQTSGDGTRLENRRAQLLVAYYF